MALHRDGQTIPYRRAYECNFANGLVTDTYVRSILLNMNLLNADLNNGIDLTAFKEGGCALFTFNLTPDFDIKNCQQIRDSNLRLELNFANALTNTINVYAYATYDSEIQITKNREIITDAYR